MRKVAIGLCLVAVFGFLGLLPGRSREVSALLPCRTLVISRADGTVTVRTDGGLQGRGTSYAQAMENLARSSPGNLFLGTVSAVVLAESAGSQVAAVTRDPQLRPACQLCVAEDGADPDDLTPFLASHSGGVTLSDLRIAAAEQQSVQLPRLQGRDGRYYFGEIL